MRKGPDSFGSISTPAKILAAGLALAPSTAAATDVTPGGVKAEMEGNFARWRKADTPVHISEDGSVATIVATPGLEVFIQADCPPGSSFKFHNEDSSDPYAMATSKAARDITAVPKTGRTLLGIDTPQQEGNYKLTGECSDTDTELVLNLKSTKAALGSVLQNGGNRGDGNGEYDDNGLMGGARGGRSGAPLFTLEAMPMVTFPFDATRNDGRGGFELGAYLRKGIFGIGVSNTLTLGRQHVVRNGQRTGLSGQQIINTPAVMARFNFTPVSILDVLVEAGVGAQLAEGLAQNGVNLVPSQESAAVRVKAGLGVRLAKKVSLTAAGVIEGGSVGSASVGVNVAVDIP